MVRLNKKKCSQCLQTKPLLAFAVDKRNKDGVRSPCKSCVGKYNQRWASKNIEHKKELEHLWRKNNPIKKNALGGKRRAILKKVTVEHVDYSVIYARDSWVCQLCFDIVDAKLQFPHPYSKSIDHIIPLKRSGDHSYINVQLAHLVCNQRKFVS